MRKILVFLFLLTLILSNIWAANILASEDPFSIYDNWNVYKIRINNPEDAYSIDTMENIFVFNHTNNSITVHAYDKVIEDLIDKGYKIKYLRHLYTPDFDRALYHSWDSVQSEIAYYIANHPNIAKCDTIGWSVQNKPILSVKISDNVNQDELEGKIQFNGCHHGNEPIATEINLYFMRYLLDNYGTNQEVDSLIHNREIFIIPVVNPDGFVSNSRYNANGIDLNRDYGFQWFQTSGATIPFSEVESRAMRADYIKYCYTISIDYHSIAEYVNFLWDYAPYQIPDYTEEVVLFSVPYADSSGYDTINGYGWYQACGSCQDASYGLFGALDVTIESQQHSDPGPECLRNLSAMLMVAKLSGYGIAGYITDSLTGDPLEAVLFFKQGSNKRWIMNSRQVNGEYHKILSAGSYEVTAHIPGYLSKTQSVQIYQDTFTRLDFQLTSDNSNYFGVRILTARQERVSPFINNTYAFDVLGPPDGEFMSMNQHGYVIIDMGENTPIADLPGYDLFIHEGNDGLTEGCVVWAGNSPEWNIGWTLLGTITGTDSFDLSASGLSQVRYLKILDDGGATSGSTPGYDLDAVTSNGHTSSVEEGEVNNKIFYSINNVISNTGPSIRFSLPNSTNVNFSIFDISGRKILDYNNNYQHGNHTWTWDRRANQVALGIYFLRAIFGDEQKTFKFKIID